METVMEWGFRITQSRGHQLVTLLIFYEQRHHKMVKFNSAQMSCRDQAQYYIYIVLISMLIAVLITVLIALIITHTST